MSRRLTTVVVYAALGTAGLTACGHPPTATDADTGRVFRRPSPPVEPPNDAAASPAATARRFARAYLRWEIGRARNQDVRTLRELASARIAATHFNRPPRRPNSAGGIPAPAVLIDVIISTESQVAGTVSADAIIRRNSRIDELNLALTQTPRGLRVTTLIPPDGA